MRGLLFAQFSITVHSATIHRHLEGAVVTTKKAIASPVDRNRPDVVLNRVNYARWFDICRPGLIYYYQDEFGVSAWTVKQSDRTITYITYNLVLNVL